MSRGWTPEEDDPRWDDEGYWDSVSRQLDSIAAQWSHIHDTEERSYWEQQANFENGYNDYEFEDEADMAYHYAQKALQQELVDAQVRVLEAKLHELGARMMRPYEHWNEDEHYMEYMENRYSY